MLILGVLSAGAKPFVVEGYVSPALTPYDLEADYVLSLDPSGRIFVALKDPRGLILYQPNCRVRIVGKPGLDRIVNDLALIEVQEVQPAGWSQPESRLCPPSIASWAGCADTFYPSLAEEPLPRGPTFNAGSPPPPDSDGDGVPDYLDAFPIDPAETTDTDGDGVGNNADPDDDNDGIPDGYELLYGLNSLVDDSGLDLDLDGMSNRDEFLSGTAANDPGSVFRVDAPEIFRDVVRLRFQSVPSRVYAVYGTHKPGERFELIGEPVRARDKQTLIELPYDPRQPYGVYQIQVLAE